MQKSIYNIRLAQRLLNISKEQSFQVDMSTMLALCEKAEQDIRSCLATLYFLKTKKKQLRYSDIVNLTIGQKDNHKSLFQGIILSSLNGGIYLKIMFLQFGKKSFTFLDPRGANIMTLLNVNPFCQWRLT